MTLKTILVSLNDLERLDALLETAGGLALEHDAHLTGLFVIPALRVYPVVTLQVPPEFFESQRKMYGEQAEEARRKFEDYCTANGLRHEWRKAESLSPLIADIVIEHARECDLLVASQPPEEETAMIEADFAERVIMETGRPVLFVPRRGRFKTVGTEVVAGWNASRESARAIYDSLPILQKAKKVRLAWVDPQKDEDAEDLPGASMAAALARHDINAQADALVSGGIDVGEVLLNHVDDTGADLLVMGAWGHSRLREYVFGGATQNILGHMTVPVIFSH